MARLRPRSRSRLKSSSNLDGLDLLDFLRFAEFITISRSWSLPLWRFRFAVRVGDLGVIQVAGCLGSGEALREVLDVSNIMKEDQVWRG